MHKNTKEERKQDTKRGVIEIVVPGATKTNENSFLNYLKNHADFAEKDEPEEQESRGTHSKTKLESLHLARHDGKTNTVSSRSNASYQDVCANFILDSVQNTQQMDSQNKKETHQEANKKEVPGIWRPLQKKSEEELEYVKGARKTSKHRQKPRKVQKVVTLNFDKNYVPPQLVQSAPPVVNRWLQKEGSKLFASGAAMEDVELQRAIRESLRTADFEKNRQDMELQFYGGSRNNPRKGCKNDRNFTKTVPLDRSSELEENWDLSGSLEFYNKDKTCRVPGDVSFGLKEKDSSDVKQNWANTSHTSVKYQQLVPMSEENWDIPDKIEARNVMKKMITTLHKPESSKNYGRNKSKPLWEDEFLKYETKSSAVVAKRETASDTNLKDREDKTDNQKKTSGRLIFVNEEEKEEKEKNTQGTYKVNKKTVVPQDIALSSEDNESDTSLDEFVVFAKEDIPQLSNLETCSHSSEIETYSFPVPSKPVSNSVSVDDVSRYLERILITEIINLEIQKSNALQSENDALKRSLENQMALKQISLMQEQQQQHLKQQLQLQQQQPHLGETGQVLPNAALNVETNCLSQSNVINCQNATTDTASESCSSYISPQIPEEESREMCLIENLNMKILRLEKEINKQKLLSESPPEKVEAVPDQPQEEVVEDCNLSEQLPYHMVYPPPPLHHPPPYPPPQPPLFYPYYPTPAPAPWLPHEQVPFMTPYVYPSGGQQVWPSAPHFPGVPDYSDSANY